MTNRKGKKRLPMYKNKPYIILLKMVREYPQNTVRLSKRVNKNQSIVYKQCNYLEKVGLMNKNKFTAERDLTVKGIIFLDKLKTYESRLRRIRTLSLTIEPLERKLMELEWKKN